MEMSEDVSFIKQEVKEEIQTPDFGARNKDFPNATPGYETIGAGHIKEMGVSRASNTDKVTSISISMPTTPRGNTILDNPSGEVVSKTKFYSQVLSRSTEDMESSTDEMNNNSNNNNNIPLKNPALDRLRHNARFDSFKTWSGKLERQLSQLRGVSLEQQQIPNQGNEVMPVSVDRYFAALGGPELDTLRPSEELVLPEDSKWPFLLRFPIASFGICLGVSSQAILWKTLATAPSMSFLRVSPIVNMLLWCISIVLVVMVSLTYALKLIFYFEAVRREYYHPIRVNFVFAPFIAILFLVQGVPQPHFKHLPHVFWYVVMTPFLFLEVKIYGQWMSGGQRRLSKVANPSNHLSIVGNFVGALLGASMGLKEGPLFFFAIGLAHYIVLFVTLYQRHPTNETLPKELHPVFFLFVAAPSVASMAWAKINGSFDSGARIAYFIALFLYFSLVVRINFFRGFRFSLAWWAYTFLMTGAAIATITYANQVTNWMTKSLAILLSAVATLVVAALLVATLVHVFVFKNLFPNDIAIAITDRPPKPHKRWFPLIRSGSSDTSDIEHYLKFVHPEPTNDGNDLEASGESARNYGQK